MKIKKFSNQRKISEILKKVPQAEEILKKKKTGEKLKSSRIKIN